VFHVQDYGELYVSTACTLFVCIYITNKCNQYVICLSFIPFIRLFMRNIQTAVSPHPLKIGHMFIWTYLLGIVNTHSTVQSPPWDANCFAASQEIPLISRTPKVYYRTHKRPPTFPILGQPNPVHIPTSQLLEIHPNIIHPSTPRSPQWSLSLRFPQQEHIQLPLTHKRHMPSPSHS